LLLGQIRMAAKAFAAVVLTGPRRCGKTYLLRAGLRGAQYVLLEDPDVLARVKADPRSFLDGLALPVIIDEIQHAPELFAYLRTRIDANPRKTGQWFLAGSQEASLMQGVSESMAGRAAIFQMLPIAREESPKVSVLNGGFPEVLARPTARSLWFSSYLQTYLERDVRAVLNVRNLSVFRRFLGLIASRHGQLLNRTELAQPLGLSIPAISEWINVLETTGLLLLVPPYFSNLGKRLLKSPKLYLCDSGLACHLLGIQSQAELLRSPFLGAITEGSVAAELVKAQINRGARRELYFFRDQQGLEVDFLLPHRGVTVLIEVKTSSTPLPAMTKSLWQLSRAFGSEPTRAVLVHGDSRSAPNMTALAPDVEARTLDGLIAELFLPGSNRP
jgi:uncharacterized protein